LTRPICACSGFATWQSSKSTYEPGSPFLSS
jgi:hypothetical protein